MCSIYGSWILAINLESSLGSGPAQINLLVSAISKIAAIVVTYTLIIVGTKNIQK